MVKIQAKAGKQLKTPEYASAIQEIKKNKCPDVGMSASACFLLNSLISTYADRLVKKTGQLARYDEKATMKQKHAATATNMVLIGPLAKHNSRFCNEAMQKFVDSQSA